MNLEKDKQKIVILDIRDSPWHDGPGRTIIEIAAGLKPQGFDIRIASFVSAKSGDSDYLKKAREKGLECVEIKEQKTFDFSIVGQIVALHKNRPFQIIHTHDLRSNVFGLLAARKLKLPVVSTMHGWIANSLKRKAIMVLGNVMLSHMFDAVIVVSDSARKRLASYLPSCQLVTIHNTLVTAYYQRRESDRFRQLLKISKETPLIAKIGRLSPEKRQEKLVVAARKLVDEGYDFKIALIGVGPDERKLRNLVEQLNLEDVVVFTGFIEDMRSIYNELDLVVQTSSTEGLPNVILEAMLMRVPVIATDVGGTSEVINSAEVGTLIEADSDIALQTALKSFLDSPVAYRSKLDKAEKRIREEFDSKRRLEKMAAFYRYLLEKKK